MTRTRAPLRLLFGLLLPIAGIAAVPAASAESKEYVITMGNMSYGRVPTGIKVGDTIVWVNQDSVIHSATARDRSFDVRANPGQKVRMTVKKAGTIPFYCTFHSMMRGTLTVSN